MPRHLGKAARGGGGGCPRKGAEGGEGAVSKGLLAGR